MKKYLFKTAWLTIISVILLIFNGCSDDSNEPQSPISSNMVCTNWGASKAEVMKHMKKFEMKIMDNDFICYNGKNNIQTISYQFQNDELHASLILIPQDNTSLSEIQSSFSKYEYIGEKNGIEIYVSEKTNTMATIALSVKGGTSYYAVGYTVLDIDTSY